VERIGARAGRATAVVLTDGTRLPAAAVVTAVDVRTPPARTRCSYISLDQLAFLRPTRRLSGHTVPGVAGLFTCGASTAPVGGIAGSSGKAAALELLKATPA